MRGIGYLYIRYILISMLSCFFLFQSASAGGIWFSKAREVTQFPYVFSSTRAAGDISTTVFDVVISLYNDPSGDDDPDNDTGSEDQTDYEEILRFWADAIYEQSNGALKLGKVRIFRNGIYGSLADVVWNASAWPSGAPSGFGVSGRHITFGDVFTDGCGSGCDIDFLIRREEGGYTLGHEFGHYVLGLYDEYRGNVATHPNIYWPLSGDTPVSNSIMNDQWSAITDTGGRDFNWLNHSTSDNYEANTGQGRAYGASGWEVMIREVGDDPKDGSRSTLSQRVRYTALVGQEPTAADSWIVLELPGGRTDARDKLEIIWMQDDIEMQIVLDRSSSMNGDPFANAKTAATALVDEVENDKTALGVVSFDETPIQDQPIVSIPDPPGTVKDDIKTLIQNLSIGNRTAMFDGAMLALDNLTDYATDNSTNAAQLVFLLSDGVDNESSETQATVTAAYQAADVPLSTFAYGSFAPEGVLRELAADTGGLFRVSPTDLAEIQSAFLATKAALTSSAAILQQTAEVPSDGGAVYFPFAVDSGLKELSIFINHVGGAGDIDVILNGPDGSAASATFTCTEVSGITSCSAAVDEAAVAASGIGEWTLIATNTTTMAVDVNVSILATPFPVRVFDLVVSSLNGTAVTYPEPILLTATPSQGLAITGVNISATVTDPAGTTSSIIFVDTGMNGDGIAGDGVYSAILNYTMNGNYSINVMVNNASQTAQFTMNGNAPAFSPTIDGVTPTPVFPPITENFTRTASLQLVVSGVMDDDHPNFIPGTSVQPDNSDVPGRIEMSGDVDVFTVPTTGLDYLFFRVTGLFFGMEPRLRVLADDGTEIIAATLDQMPDGAQYLALAVPVNGSTHLHAEVSHSSGGTGTYTFSSGRRISSDPELFGLDIMPTTEENPVNPGARGRIPVVILGSELYDVRDIDSSTLAFGPSGAPALHPHGVFGDFNGDGLTDYLNHYSIKQSGIMDGDEQACITGLAASVPFTACDYIRTVP